MSSRPKKLLFLCTPFRKRQGPLTISRCRRKVFSYSTSSPRTSSTDRPCPSMYHPKPTHVEVHPGMHVLQLAVGASELREVAGFRGLHPVRSSSSQVWCELCALQAVPFPLPRWIIWILRRLESCSTRFTSASASETPNLNIFLVENHEIFISMNLSPVHVWDGALDWMSKRNAVVGCFGRDQQLSVPPTCIDQVIAWKVMLRKSG